MGMDIYAALLGRASSGGGGGGGGALVISGTVNIETTTITLNCTWQEVRDALASGANVVYVGDWISWSGDNVVTSPIVQTVLSAAQEPSGDYYYISFQYDGASSETAEGTLVFTLG